MGLFFLALTAVAQTSEFEGRTVEQVDFQPPGILDPADLQRVQSLKPGVTFQAEAVAAQIDGLFATGEFDDIKAEANRSGSGVAVTFVTVPKRYLSGLRIEGKVSNPPSHGELSSLPELTRGGVFTDRQLADALEMIRQNLKSNGLYEATVSSDTKADSTGQQIFLTLTIHYGRRARYEQPVIHGDSSLSAATIARATGWRMRFIRRWRAVTASRSMNGLDGILRKYQSQHHLAAQAQAESWDYDAQRRRLKPTLNLDAGPKITISATETKVSNRILKRYVPVFQDGAVDDDLLAEGARNLRDYFESKGYFDAAVDFRVSMPGPDEETVEFAISRGQRYKLAHLTLLGNHYFDEGTLRERLFMEPASFHLWHGRYSEAFQKRDQETILNLYRANGFREVKVTAERVPGANGSTGDVGVVIRIEEGPQWIVNSLAWQGISADQRDALSAVIASSPGQPFSEVSLASDRSLILEYLTSRGFLSAQCAAAWKPAGAPNRADLVYTITPGEQQFVGKILMTGLRETRRKLIDERMTLHAGDPLSELQQRAIQQSLYDMGVFARVDTAIENPDGETTRKNLLYAFDEANRYSITVGVGAQVGQFGTPSTTTLAAPGGTTGFSPEGSLRADRLNFLGTGDTVSLRGAYGTLEKRGSLSYYMPLFRKAGGRSLTFSLLYDNTLDVRTFAAKREEASVQLSQTFSRGLTGLFRFAYRNVSVNDVIIPVLLIPQLTQAVRIGIVSGNLARDHRDNAADPHRGSYNTLDLSLATRYFGSQRSFGKALLRNATYYRLSRNVVLARQTQFGVIAPFSNPAGLDNQASVPLPERFFGGGADSLRAFPYNQAGPRDTGAPVTQGGPSSKATGFPLGGNALFFNNVELRFPLIGANLQGVLFHDFGNVYSTLSHISFRFNQRNPGDFDYAVHAVGLGLRYRTPVGPIRLDLAYSINPPSYLGFSGTPLQLLQCGQNSTASNCQSTPQSISHFQFFFSIGQTF